MEKKVAALLVIGLVLVAIGAAWSQKSDNNYGLYLVFGGAIILIINLVIQFSRRKGSKE